MGHGTSEYVTFIWDITHSPMTHSQTLLGFNTNPSTWHDSFIWDRTHSYGTWEFSIWDIHMGYHSFTRDMTPSQTSLAFHINLSTWHDSFVWDIYSFMWNVPLSYETYLIHMGHDSFKWDITHSYGIRLFRMGHDWLIRMGHDVTFTNLVSIRRDPLNIHTLELLELAGAVTYQKNGRHKNVKEKLQNKREAVIRQEKNISKKTFSFHTVKHDGLAGAVIWKKKFKNGAYSTGGVFNQWMSKKN